MPSSFGLVADRVSGEIEEDLLEAGRDDPQRLEHGVVLTRDPDKSAEASFLIHSLNGVAEFVLRDDLRDTWSRQQRDGEAWYRLGERNVNRGA